MPENITLSPKSRSGDAWRAHFQAIFHSQNQRYGGEEWGWTEQAFTLIDSAISEVEAAIAAGGRGRFEDAVAAFIRRSTPVTVLAQQALDNPANVGLWIVAMREAAERGLIAPVLVMRGVKRLDGRDLVFRVCGALQDGEVPLDDLPAVLTVAQRASDDTALAGALGALSTVRRRYPAAGPVRFVAEGAGGAGRAQVAQGVAA